MIDSPIFARPMTFRPSQSKFVSDAWTYGDGRQTDLHAVNCLFGAKIPSLRTTAPLFGFNLSYLHHLKQIKG
ncbi:hypothetical protein AB4Z22_12370, partial [Paenibacillus sp. TAF58]